MLADSPGLEDDDDLDPEFDTKGVTFARLIVAAMVIASFGVWVYAYSGQADRPDPDLLNLDTFVDEAGPICDAAMAEFEALPSALDARDNVERAAQIRASNVVLSQMIDDLEDATGGTPRDVTIIGKWLTDWRAFVDHRADYADRFELDESERFYISAVGVERLDKRITRVANTNFIPSCATPNDIG